MTGKTIVKDITSIPETVAWIKKLTIEASKNPIVKQIAKECLQSPDPIRCVFDTAYEMLIYRPDEIECKECGWVGVKADRIEKKNCCPDCGTDNLKLKQQLRTIENILRQGKGNCTHYATLIGAILINMAVKFKLRVVGYEKPNQYDHIYVVTNSGTILDPVQGQRQDGTDTKYNRPPKGKFNQEVFYKYKLDYPMPQLEILQGTLGCDPQLRPIVQNRNTASRLGLISGHVGCGIVDNVVGFAIGKKAKQRQLERRIEKRKAKTADEIKLIYAKADAERGPATTSPLNIDSINDKLSSFFQNSSGNTGIVPGVAPSSGDQQQIIPAGDGKILGMDKTTAIIVGLGVAGVGAYLMFKR